MKTIKVPGHLDASLEMIATSGEVVIQVRVCVREFPLDVECQLDRPQVLRSKF